MATDNNDDSMDEVIEYLSKIPTFKSAGVQLQDRFGNTFYMGNAGDFWMPAFPIPPGSDYRDLVTNCTTAEMRDGDIFVCSFPKTGSHWTTAMIGMLLRNSSEFDHTTKFGLLETNYSLLAKHMPSPRILHTHLPFRHIPKDAFTKKVKIVVTQRNLKDTLVSFFHHKASLKDQLSWNGSFEHFFWNRMELGGDYGDIFDYHMEWQKGMEAHPELDVYENVYEDAKADPVGAVKRLNEFLGTGCSAEMCADIAKSCQFKSQKKAIDQKAPDFIKKLYKNDKQAIYRKGEVGDWQNYFTDEMNEYFEGQYKKRMSGYKRIPKYTL